MRSATEMLHLGHAEHLATFRIPSAILEGAGVESVTDSDARGRLGLNGHHNDDLGGILFPYRSPLTGERTGGRIRLDRPLSVGGKYISEPGCRHLFFPPDVAGLLRDANISVVIVEAEKSALALMALTARTGRKLLAMAVGGCWGWRRNDGKRPLSNGGSETKTSASPDFELIAWQGRSALLAFDSNAESNPEVQRARNALAKELAARGAIVSIAEVPAIDGVNGPDDLIAVSGDAAALQMLAAAKPSAPNAMQFSSPAWPEPLAAQAFHGLAGEIVRAIEPHTESDPAALLTQLLVGFGNLVGRGAYATVEADRHGCNLFCALVGVTAKGRKGTAWGQIRRLLERVEPDWAKGRIQSGLSSGEGLVWAVRDKIEKQEAVRESRRVVDYQTVVEDPGISDKRLLLTEPELASTLRVMGREGSTLSPIVRQAWDTGDLRVLTKNTPACATGAHISIVGHITRDELLRHLNSTEAANGFANRFLWVCARRSKELPEGGRIQDVDFAPLIDRLLRAAEAARSAGELQRDENARNIWRVVYGPLSEGRPGLLGSVTSRAEAQVLRLSLLYALLDGAHVVSAAHLEAALAVWEYAEASARYIFGDALGYPQADRLLKELRNAPRGLTRTDIQNLFGRHCESVEIESALRLLSERGSVRCTKEQTDGRPVERWFAVVAAAKEASKAEKAK
ncbi:MAG: DUF3987 domain-containing protein [Candidatus Acidiferrum sp.]